MRRRTVSTVLLHAALVLGAALALLPMVWMVSASLMPAGEAASFPPRLFPRTVTFEHYAALFFMGTLLFVITFVSNSLGQWVIGGMRRRMQGTA